MAQTSKREEDSVLAWTLLILGVVALFVGMIWLVGSHLVVYYFTPVLDVLAAPYRWLPRSAVGTIPADLDATLILYRAYPNRIALLDWLGYCNVALRPAAVAFLGVAALLFFRQVRKVERSRLNKKMSPERLAEDMITVFTDIAPVVKIQKALIDDRLPGWRRQTFPDEFLRQARVGGKPVLVMDEASERLDDPNADRDSQLIVHPERLDQHLQADRIIQVGDERLLQKRYLGRQIVNLMRDMKSKPEDVVFPDRLSDAGKVIFAIMAPYAFGGPAGRAESRRLYDALNLSAFGSPTGMANLSIPLAAETFEKWRAHPLARNLAKIHHWEYTFLFGLLKQARRNGKFGPWSFIWIKPTDRVMFYVLDSEGRETPHTEGAMSFSQSEFELRCARLGYLPIRRRDDNTFEHIVLSKYVHQGLTEEWEAWRSGADENEDWWQKNDVWRSSNSAILDAFASINAAPPPPPTGDN
ncbi:MULTISPECIES: secretion/conjugation apparatus DotM-related subunit [unclassified Cupriavidus]|uniref:secretion/conjugation apparatus DotM-related subunit n=1 Tax=unclassified Cupriavidus TaxID=2640874 RepID=UPI00313F2C37